MPTETVVVGAAEYRIPSDSERTVLIIQKQLAPNILYVYDKAGTLYTTGIALAVLGASITLRKSDGEEPEGDWFLYATGAGTATNIIELYGVPSIVEVRVTTEPEEPSPQEPQPKTDAPKMRKIKPKDKGYR